MITLAPPCVSQSLDVNGMPSFERPAGGAFRMDAEGERLPSRLGLTIGLTIEQTIGIGLYVQPIYTAEPLQIVYTNDIQR